LTQYKVEAIQAGLCGRGPDDLHTGDALGGYCGADREIDPIAAAM
jgi:hypothetical protein